jgi:hypothetical protein
LSGVDGAGVDGARFETLAALELELRQLWPALATMAGMSQLWAEMGMGFKQYHIGQNWHEQHHKCQIINNGLMAKYERKMGNLDLFFFFF